MRQIDDVGEDALVYEPGAPLQPAVHAIGNLLAVKEGALRDPAFDMAAGQIPLLDADRDQHVKLFLPVQVVDGSRPAQLEGRQRRLDVQSQAIAQRHIKPMIGVVDIPLHGGIGIERRNRSRSRLRRSCRAPAGSDSIQCPCRPTRSRLRRSASGEVRDQIEAELAAPSNIGRRHAHQLSILVHSAASAGSASLPHASQPARAGPRLFSSIFGRLGK